jgi:hypothetical protein
MTTMGGDILGTVVNSVTTRIARIALFDQSVPVTYRNMGIILPLILLAVAR